jgi:hypothetical protein
MAVEFKGLGYVTVVSAGTPVVLSASKIMVAGCLIQAPSTNAGVVYVGGADLDATQRAAELSPGSAIEIVGPSIRGIEEEFDLARIKVDAANSGDKVSVSYFIRS